MFAYFNGLTLATRLWILVIVAGVIFAAGGTTGYKVRDYFADRKEIKQLKSNLANWEKAAEDYKLAANRYRARAIDAEAKRQENRTQATTHAATVDPSKLTHFEKGKCDVQTNSCSCERTDRCHWLHLNAAYDGTEAPAECSLGMPDKVQGEQLPDAAVDREGDRARPPSH